MAGRAEKEKRTGKKTPGRKPKPPEPGPRDSDQVNFTDPQSRIMLTSSKGWQQAYNLQSSVDMNSYMIVGGYVSQATNDKQQLEPMVDQLEGLPEELGTVERVAADAGYFSKHNTKGVTDRRGGALHFHWPPRTSYELEAATGRSRSAAEGSDASGGDEMAAENERRPGVLRKAKING